MHDSGKIITGIVIFLGLMTFPFWYNVGRAAYERPELQLPKDVEQCIEATEWMQAEHMVLLNDWRDVVVRDGERIYHATDGKTYNMSLQNTCMECHQTKEKFCDRCHDTASVSPYCWDCHIAPVEEES